MRFKGVVLMIENYLNQSATWKHVATTNEYNEHTYAADATIKCRREMGFKLVRNKQGQEVVSSACYFTKSAVTVDDLLDGELVIAANGEVGLSGNIEFYECYTL